MVIAASSAIVRAVTCTSGGGSTTWTATSGSWFTSGNWSNGVPNGTKCAFINNGGDATIGSSGGTATSYNLILGNFQGNSGSVEVDAGALEVVGPIDLDCGGEIYAGSQGSGTLTISEGGTVNARNLYIGAGTNVTRPNGSGTVTVKDSGSSLTLNPGECSGAGICIGCAPDFSNAGTGVLNIQGGTVEVDNTGTVSLPGVRVGISGTLEGGGTLTLTGTSVGAKTVAVRGTVAPSGTLTIAGDLDLTDGGSTLHAATTIFHVTPTAQD